MIREAASLAFVTQGSPGQVTMAKRINSKAAGPFVPDLSGSPVVECRSVWKIFGQERIPGSVTERILSGEISAETAKSKYKCIIGVQDVSFSVARGEIFCIMGMSGSGKSTLIRHINRLIEPTSGDILIDSQSIRQFTARELRALRATGVGMVFQNMALLPHRTVAHNVGLSLELRRVDYRKRLNTITKVLEIVGLDGWGGHKLHELSGGMQQRVGLARALAADPEILLLDEPFSALDPLIRRQLQDEFKNLSRDMGKTTVFITHDLEEAVRLGDRIAIMKEGRFVQVGTPAEIVMRPADQFVASFVKGISRLHIVNARHLMLPADEFLSSSGVSHESLDALNSVTPDTSLQALIDLFVYNQRPIAVRETGKLLGVVPLQAILEAMREEN